MPIIDKRVIFDESDFPSLPAKEGLKGKQNKLLFHFDCYRSEGFEDGKEVTLYKDIWIIILKMVLIFSSYNYSLMEWPINCWNFRGTIRLVCKSWAQWIEPLCDVNYGDVLVRSIEKKDKEAIFHFLSRRGKTMKKKHLERTFFKACMVGNAWVVDVMINRLSFDPSSKHNLGLALACLYSKPLTVSTLLKDSRVGPFDQREFEKTSDWGESYDDDIRYGQSDSIRDDIFGSL